METGKLERCIFYGTGLEIGIITARAVIPSVSGRFNDSPILPGEAWHGAIVAAGPGKNDEPITVKPGNMILCSKYAGSEIQINGKELRILRESYIFAIL